MGELAVVIDRSSPVPLWFQAAGQVEAAIARGDLAPGDRLDNEVDLAARWGLSRPTVRQAIEDLVAKGLLVRKRGVGTQVVHGGLKRSLELSSLYDDLAAAHRRPGTRVLSFGTEAADATTASALGLSVGDPVVAVRRVRTAGGDPLAVLANWLPADLVGFTAADLEAGGLYALLRAGGVHLRVANQRISALAADAEQARLLGLRRGAPLLSMSRTTYDDSGRPVELGSHVYRPDGYSVEVRLVSR